MAGCGANARRARRPKVDIRGPFSNVLSARPGDHPFIIVAMERGVIGEIAHPTKRAL
jgi:hypothetical protein